MKELNRRKFLKWMGVSAATVTTGAFVCDDCSVAYASQVASGPTNTRCPHVFCRRYRAPQDETTSKTYDLYTDKEGYCLSKAFKGLPRV